MRNVGGGWSLGHESPVPGRTAPGAGSGLFVSGWLFHEDAPTIAVSLSCGDGPPVPVDAHSMGRPEIRDVLTDLTEPARRRAQASGFWGMVPLPRVETETTVPIILRARAANGAELERVIGYPVLVPDEAGAAPSDGAPADPELVICLATWEPDPALFAAQIASIQAQTHRSWRCIVSDDGSSDRARALIAAAVEGDERFTIVLHPQNVGFYWNFERALRQVPSSATFVALADQDDVWFPEKLERLVAACGGDDVTLAYGDMHVVERDGTVRHASFWTSRTNDHCSLASLLSSNVVTGAASVFDRRLLDVALPFPPQWRGAYHDHWIALTALATGRIAFVDEPVQAYVQHDQQVVGHGARATSAGVALHRMVGSPWWVRRWWANVVTGGNAYVRHTLFRRWVAMLLLERVEGSLAPRKRRALERAVRGDRGARGLLLTLGRSVAGRRAGGFYALELQGALWRRRNRRMARRRDPDGALEPAARHFDDVVRYRPDDGG